VQGEESWSWSGRMRWSLRSSGSARLRSGLEWMTLVSPPGTEGTGSTRITGGRGTTLDQDGTEWSARIGPRSRSRGWFVRALRREPSPTDAQALACRDYGWLPCHERVARRRQPRRGAAPEAEHNAGARLDAGLLGEPARQLDGIDQGAKRPLGVARQGTLAWVFESRAYP
jgi:hypothetical protein